MSPNSSNISSANQAPINNNNSTNSSSSANTSTSTKSSSQNGLKKENLSALSKQDVLISQQGNPYSKEEIREIQDAIERGLTCYKSKMEIFTVLKGVDQNIVNLIWQKLEQNNPRFFTAYLIRLAVIKQVKVFQQLLTEQNKLKAATPSKTVVSSGTTTTSNTTSTPSSTSLVNTPSSITMNNTSMGLPFNQSGSSILNNIQGGSSQHSSQIIPNSMNLSMFGSGLMSQSFDQGRRNSITNMTGSTNSNMIPQTVNSNRFSSPIMQFSGSFMQMQPHMNFSNNQQFPGNSMGYQNPTFGPILPQGASNEQQYNPYSSFSTFSMTGNPNLSGHSSNGSGNFPIGQQSTRKTSSGKSSDLLDDDVFQM